MDDYYINSATDFGSSNSNYMNDYDVNPATGLPMINGSSVDVSGNGFGSSNSYHTDEMFNSNTSFRKENVGDNDNTNIWNWFALFIVIANIFGFLLAIYKIFF